MPTATFTPNSSGKPVEVSCLIDTIWIDKSVKLPYKLSDKFIIHDFYKGLYPYKEQIQNWVKSQNNWGSFPYLIELKGEYKRQEYNQLYVSLQNLTRIIRLVKYNRVYLRYFLCIDKGKISMWTTNTDSRPSSFLGKKEELNNSSLILIKDIYATFKKILEQKLNQRILRSYLFWNDSTCSDRFESKVVNLFIALESLFTIGFDEVTYKLANRMSWFASKSDIDKRIDLFQKIKQGYRIRSGVVHGKKFVETKDLPLIQELHSITREIILSIIKDKKLLEIYTNTDKEPETFLNNLVLGVN